MVGANRRTSEGHRRSALRIGLSGRKFGPGILVTSSIAKGRIEAMELSEAKATRT